MNVVGSSQKPDCMTGRKFEAESHESRVSFIGRSVRRCTGLVWCLTHHMVLQPPCLFGALVGGAAGVVSGSIYKIYKNAVGQGADTKKIADYAVKLAGKVYHLAKNILDKPLRFVSTALFVPAALGGMAIAVVGTALPAVGCAVYKMMKHVIGQGAETKKLSEYAIDLLDLGAVLFVGGTASTIVLGPMIAAGFFPIAGYPIVFCLLAVGGPAAVCQWLSPRSLFPRSAS